MIDKLSDAEARFSRIESSLSDPETVSDIEKYTKLMKEHRALLPLIEKYREYKKVKNDAGGGTGACAPFPRAVFHAFARKKRD